MNEIFVKYFFITVFTIFSYYKLLNLKKPIYKTLYIYIFYIISFCFTIAYLVPIQEYFSIISSFSSLFILIFINSKIHFKLSFTSYIISYVFSYSIYVYSNLLLLLLIYPFDNNLTINTSIEFLLAGIIGTLILTKIFHIKRLSKGMPFLLNKLSSYTGIIISAIGLNCSIMLNNKENTNKIYIPLVLFLLISSIIILQWWKFHLKKLYLEHLKDAEIIRLQQQIQQQTEIISSLEKNNQDLATIIHKDNKLIPAMEFAVTELLNHYSNDKENIYSTDAKLLLNDLKDLSLERTGIIHDYNIKHQTLQSTGISSTDSILSYMSMKALQYNIQFDLSVTKNIKQICLSTINIKDLNTLLADFIDNAINATKDKKSGRILVCIRTQNNIFQINCYDNGLPFKIETLLKLGQLPYTTYPNEGGNGIGYNTIFKIKTFYNASLCIENFTDEELYSKNISMSFDGQGNYTIK